jgi:ubiquinone/menaquinone biosynthesis C-methylase UbiE
MAAPYNTIADGYKEHIDITSRRHAEEYTYFHVIKGISGKYVLDLACGEGFYTRKFKQKGAAHVIGMDISEAMIELAKQEEKSHPLGIEYRVRDALKLGELKKVDMIAAAFLLNYMQTKEQLLQVSRNIYNNLKPGGRFVTITENPELPSHAYSTMQYGVAKKVPEPLHEGACITVTLSTADDQKGVSFNTYWLPKAVYDSVLLEAGFKEVLWHPVKISPDGIQKTGSEYWEYLLKYPYFSCIECVKES